MVNGMNCRMLPLLSCSRQSTHSSMNHCTNWVWGPAVREPRMEEMSRNRLAVQRGNKTAEFHNRSDKKGGLGGNARSSESSHRKGSDGGHGRRVETTD